MSIKMILVDDEQLALETMEEYIHQLFPSAQTHAFFCAEDALAFLHNEPADIALLDISMPGSINGIALAIRMKAIAPSIKILFCTAYSEYALDAIKMHATGYLCKPLMKDDLKNELIHALGEHSLKTMSKPFLHTFGNFDVFVHGKPLLFRRSKSKEVLAWLVDRKGTWGTNKEAVCVLWQEDASNMMTEKYVSLIIKEMINDLEAYGIADIVERKRGQIRLCTEQVECDYYAMREGNVDMINRFNGEYMSQYSWGEITLTNLLKTTYL